MSIMGAIDKLNQSGATKMDETRKEQAEDVWEKDTSGTTKANQGKWKKEWWGTLHPTMVTHLGSCKGASGDSGGDVVRAGVGQKKAKLRCVRRVCVRHALRCNASDARPACDVLPQGPRPEPPKECYESPASQPGAHKRHAPVSAHTCSSSHNAHAQGGASAADAAGCGAAPAQGRWRP